MVVVVSGACWVVVDGLGDCVCEVPGALVVEFGVCANAAVANTRPTAVVIKKRVFMYSFSGCGLQEREDQLRVPEEPGKLGKGR